MTLDERRADPGRINERRAEIQFVPGGPGAAERRWGMLKLKEPGESSDRALPRGADSSTGCCAHGLIVDRLQAFQSSVRQRTVEDLRRRFPRRPARAKPGYRPTPHPLRAVAKACFHHDQGEGRHCSGLPRCAASPVGHTNQHQRLITSISFGTLNPPRAGWDYPRPNR